MSRITRVKALVSTLFSVSAICLLPGCLYPNKACRLSIGGELLSVVPVEVPYRLRLDKHEFLGYNPYNLELRRSKDNAVMPFGVVCGGGEKGLVYITYAEINLTSSGYSLTWLTREILFCSLEELRKGPIAYKLTLSEDNIRSANINNPPSLCRMSVHEASQASICSSREQIVIFTSIGILVRRGSTGNFSWVRFPSVLIH